MAEFADINAFELALDQAIDSVMVMYVQDNAKEAIQDAEEEKVYSYNPIFYSRRREDGGIRSKWNMKGNYDPTEKELTIEVSAPYQNLKGNNKVELIPIVEAIETMKMYHAPARPFLQYAENTYGKERFEKDLMDGLNANGF